MREQGENEGAGKGRVTGREGKRRKEENGRERVINRMKEHIEENNGKE